MTWFKINVNSPRLKIKIPGYEELFPLTISWPVALPYLWSIRSKESRLNYYPSNKAWVKVLALFSFLFFPCSVTNRHLISRACASLVYTFGKWNLHKLSLWKASSDSMISRVMKSHTNEHTVPGRPTLKDIERFQNGSVYRDYERSIYERTFWVTLSRIMLYQGSCQLGLSTLQLDKKHLQKRCHIFRHDREPSRIPARTQNIWATRAKRLENLFLLFTNASARVHLSKTL